MKKAKQIEKKNEEKKNQWSIHNRLSPLCRLCFIHSVYLGYFAKFAKCILQ